MNVFRSQNYNAVKCMGAKTFGRFLRCFMMVVLLLLLFFPSIAAFMPLNVCSVAFYQLLRCFESRSYSYHTRPNEITVTGPNHTIQCT